MVLAEQVERHDQAQGLTRRGRNLVVVAIMLGMLLAALDQTIVATALPTIVGDVGGGNHLSWVVTSYLLAETIMTALIGKFGDLFGRLVGAWRLWLLEQLTDWDIEQDFTNAVDRMATQLIDNGKEPTTGKHAATV